MRGKRKILSWFHYILRFHGMHAWSSVCSNSSYETKTLLTYVFLCPVMLSKVFITIFANLWRKFLCESTGWSCVHVEIKIYPLARSFLLGDFSPRPKVQKARRHSCLVGHIRETPKVGRWYNLRGELDAARHRKAENYVQKTRTYKRRIALLRLLSISFPPPLPPWCINHTEGRTHACINGEHAHHPTNRLENVMQDKRACAWNHPLSWERLCR
jgi:hypothetical protein